MDEPAQSDPAAAGETEAVRAADHPATLHLAEYRADYPGKEWATQGAPVMIDGERQWVTFEDLEGDSDDFEAIGKAFAAAGFAVCRVSCLVSHLSTHLLLLYGCSRVRADRWRPVGR